MNPTLRWLLIAIAALAVLLGGITLVGAFRPAEMTMQATLEIQRPPQMVYDTLVNAENLKKWAPEVLEVKRISENPLRFQSTSSQGDSEMEFFDLKPPTSLSSRMQVPSAGVEGTWHIEIQPTAQGSRVTSQGKMTMGNPFWRGLAMFMDANAEEMRTLESLKSYLEKQGGEATN